MLRRFYIAIGVQRPGTPGTAQHRRGVPAGRCARAAAFVGAPYTETTVTLEWPPSGGIVGFLFDSALPPEEPPLERGVRADRDRAGRGGDCGCAVPAGPVKYNVYRELEPDPLALPDPTGRLPWARDAADADQSGAARAR